MAKKKKLQSQAPVPLTRGQLSRAQRERRRIRSLYATGIGLATLVVIILGFAIANTYFIKPNAQVARVNDTVINRATYNKLRRWNLYQSIQSAAIQQQLNQTGQSTFDPTSAYREQLINVENEQPLDSATVEQLIDAEVLRQKSSSEFGINPTQPELKEEALKDFVPQPTPPPAPTTEAVSASPTVTGTSSIMPTATRTATPGSPTMTPTATPTLPPVPGAQQTAQALYSSFTRSIDRSITPQPGDPFCSNGCPDISEADYLTLIIEPALRKDRVTEKLSATGVLTEVEQINAQHILTATEEGAKQLREMLDKGADFTQLANTQSSEQIDLVNQGLTTNGGNLGWFPQEGSNYVPEFVDAAFKVETGKYSQPVKTQFGWHIIKVLERDPKRPLSSDQIERKKTQLYDDWFKKAKEASTIVSSVPTPTAIPTQPPLVEPTAAPAQNASPTPGGTPGSTTGTPDASGLSATAPVTGTTGATGTATGGATPTTATTPAPAGTPGPSTPTASPGQ